MENRAARYYRDELRKARAAVLEDSESYADPFHTLERLARFLDPTVFSLGKAAPIMCELAKKSPFADELSKKWPEFHRPYVSLFQAVRDMRNDVMHTGARARHLTRYAVEACLVLEDALNQYLNSVADFMVPDVVMVELWQPVSLARQRMLEHSFTFLPVAPDAAEQWRLIADHHIARYLGGMNSRRSERLAQPVGKAIQDLGLETYEAKILSPDTPIEKARQNMGDRPFLILSGRRLVGIITAFDML